MTLISPHLLIFTVDCSILFNTGLSIFCYHLILRIKANRNIKCTYFLTCAAALSLSHSLEYNVWQQGAYNVFITVPPSRVQLSHQDSINSNSRSRTKSQYFYVYSCNNSFPQPSLLTSLCFHCWTKPMLCSGGQNTGKARLIHWHDVLLCLVYHRRRQ